MFNNKRSRSRRIHDIFISTENLKNPPPALFATPSWSRLKENDLISTGNLSIAHLLVARKSARALTINVSHLPIEASPTIFSPHPVRISNRTLELYGNEEETDNALYLSSMDSLSPSPIEPFDRGDRVDRVTSIGTIDSNSSSNLTDIPSTSKDPDYISLDMDDSIEQDENNGSYETLNLEEPVYKSQMLISLKPMKDDIPKELWNLRSHFDFLWRVDLEFISSVFNPIPFFYPLTLRYEVTMINFLE
jgi:hypothetical protein